MGRHNLNIGGEEEPERPRPRLHKNHHGDLRTSHRKPARYRLLTSLLNPDNSAIQSADSHGCNPEPVHTSAYRAPISNKLVTIEDFLKVTQGRAPKRFRSGIRYQSIDTDYMRKIYNKFDSDKAEELLQKYIQQHAGTIDYSVVELGDFQENKGQILMRAKPTDETLKALELDSTDLLNTFGIEDNFTFTGLNIGVFLGMNAYNDAERELCEILERQGGVLLTFGGVQI